MKILLVDNEYSKSPSFPLYQRGMKGGFSCALLYRPIYELLCGLAVAATEKLPRLGFGLQCCAFAVRVKTDRRFAGARRNAHSKTPYKNPVP